ncbi:NAD(P)H-hydrate epimerase [Alienimonas californiensis]|uniref:NAD(P)H-hydrate epimerase n=1 Tax=Alienimonas californiensis TaxID=2527989 RepID=A0A517P8J5_9PLAN|nr:NAD(P)H-hydrate epimerase [Alienimonas californiensis]QDT15690.1 Bifunctional NAD(P)H-hydrate repair enzyme Nnr [Alienimonas californiensis]
MESPAPPPLTVAQSRAVDRVCLEDYGLPGAVLMENAARGCAELLDRVSDGNPGAVAIVCGKGNNGGDGFALARHLTIRGATVHLFAPFEEPPDADEEPGEAAMNARVARRMGLPWTDWTTLSEEDLTNRLAEEAAGGWIVDALLGTGPSGPPREPMDVAVRAIHAARSRGPRVLAVDVPTGFDADGGRPFQSSPDGGACCVRADRTATFVAPKPGFAMDGASDWTGSVSVVGIGAPPAAIESVR